MTELKSYTRIVRTDEGGSAMEDAEIRLRHQQVSVGVPAMFAAALPSSAGVMFLRSNEFDSDPHPAPREQWVVMVRGAVGDPPFEALFVPGT